jgi:UDP-2,4-diacetamido-2,4,6-trideoxy-beta-L-altropyranose hydrolase
VTTTPALVLRTDGGPSIGGGHVMRCLALAQAWSEAGGRVGFCIAISTPSLHQRLVREDLEVIEIDAAAGTAADADATLAAAGRLGAPVVVVDGYHLSVDYRHRLRQAGLKEASLDDNAEIGRYVDDLIINPNRHAAPDLYRDGADHTRLLLGTEYALLRREFRNWQGPPRSFPEAARRILVTLGAADPSNVTAEVVASLEPILSPGMEVAIVAGGSNPHADAIAARARRLPAYRLIRDAAEDMPGLMAGADLAVCAGGSTMWEMAFMGVPFIPVIIAGNQRSAVQAMTGDGYPAVDGDEVGRDLAPLLVAMMADAGRRRELSRIGRRLVDGKGVERVCMALRHLSDTPAVA